MARVLISAADGRRSRRENPAQFVCIATLFAHGLHGAGDGNRTRTVSLGTNLMSQSTAADRLFERGAATRLSPRLTVSRRQLGHAEGTAQLSIDEVTGDPLVATARDNRCGGAGSG